MSEEVKTPSEPPEEPLEESRPPSPLVDQLTMGRTDITVGVDAHDLTLIQRLLNSYIVGISFQVEKARREKIILDYQSFEDKIKAASELQDRFALAALDALKKAHGADVIDKHIEELRARMAAKGVDVSGITGAGQ